MDWLWHDYHLNYVAYKPGIKIQFVSNEQLTLEIKSRETSKVAYT